MKLGLGLLLFVAGIVVFAEAKISGRFGTGIVSDSNIYKDSSEFSDLGLGLDFNLNYYAKVFENTYPRFGYSFSIVSFPDYNLENQNTHFLNGSIRQRLGGLITVGIGSGFFAFNLPNSDKYNSTVFFTNPFLKLYPFYYTELEVGYINKNTNYSDYDLDYAGNDFYAELKQDLPIGFNMELGAIFGKRDYNERYVYDISGSSPVKTSTKREDTENKFSVGLKRYIFIVGTVEFGYTKAVLDSNANEFYWGPKQTEDENTTVGDERVIEDYWNYKSSIFNFVFKTGSQKNLYLEFYTHYQKKDFDGWYARDISEKILSPAEFRTDKQQLYSLKAEKEIVNNLVLSGGYSFENNLSNDAPYDYKSNQFKLGLKLYF